VILSPIAEKNLRSANWRLNNLYSIIDKNSRKIPFKENFIQAKLNRSKSKRKKILKARQEGVSTNELLKQLDYTIWNPHVTTVILAHEQDAIKKLFRIVTRGYRYMPECLKPKIEGTGSKYEMYFPENNSRIYCDLESRSDTISWLHVSEYAFVKEPDMVAATIDAVPHDGIVTLETTANGMGNHFFPFWNDPESIYESFFFPWYFHAEYQIKSCKLELTDAEIELVRKASIKYGIKLTYSQIAWRRFKIKEKGPGKYKFFLQEFPEDEHTCFIASGDSAMDADIITQLRIDCIDPLRDDGITRIYKDFDKNHYYVLGADPAEGIGKDYSAVVVIDTVTLEQVATIHGHIKPADFAERIAVLANQYSHSGRLGCLVAVERNNHGHAVLLHLNESEEIRKDKRFRLYKDEKGRFGWESTRISRALMIDTFIEAIEDRDIKVRDAKILDECLTLIDNNKKIEAASGYHDDLIIALAIAIEMTTKNRKIQSLYSNLKGKIKVG